MWLDSKCSGAALWHDLEKPVYVLNEDEMHQRKFQIAKYLIESKDYVSAETIAQNLYLSNSTVIREINKLEEFFKRYYIAIERQPKKGIRLYGEEKNLRIAKAEILKKLLNPKRPIQFDYSIQEFFPTLDIGYIEMLIAELENRFSINFSDISKAGIIIHTAISIIRIMDNKFIKMPKEQLMQLKSHSEWEIAEYYVENLSKHFGIELSEDECGYIVIHLLAANLNNKVFVTTEGNSEICKLDPKTYSFMCNILIDMSIKYDFPFDNDEKLKGTLFLHIKPMINRLSNHISLNNPYLSEIKKSNTYSYEMATYLGNCLADKYHVEISDDEIGYLAMHIGASLERYLYNNAVKKNVIIVCASGLGTSQFLKERVKKEFPNFNVIDVISVYELEHNYYDCDFILSTVHISGLYKDAIYVSPVLSNEEVEKVNHYVKCTSNKVFSDFLSEKISLFQVQANDSNKYGIIRTLGKLLYENGYVDKDFTESAIKREKLSSTAIGNSIAIPHAYQGHVLKQGIAFLQLRKPIMWGDEKVQLVFLLSIDMRSESHFTRLFEEISSISKDYHKIEELTHCLDYSELIDVLK